MFIRSASPLYAQSNIRCNGIHLWGRDSAGCLGPTVSSALPFRHLSPSSFLLFFFFFLSLFLLPVSLLSSLAGSRRAPQSGRNESSRAQCVSQAKTRHPTCPRPPCRAAAAAAARSAQQEGRARSATAGRQAGRQASQSKQAAGEALAILVPRPMLCTETGVTLAEPPGPTRLTHTPSRRPLLVVTGQARAVWRLSFSLFSLCSARARIYRRC